MIKLAFRVQTPTMADIFDRNLKLWLLIFQLFSVVTATFDGTGVSWKLILDQNDRSFPSPSAQEEKADLRQCAIHCYNTPGSLSLTFHDASKTCKCYASDYQYEESYMSDPGAVFMTRNYTTVTTQTPACANPTYIVMDGTYSGSGTPCFELYAAGKRESGVYSVTPETGVTFNVFCNMSDGGWTVVQYRYDGSVNFTRTWSDYRNGFGCFDGEFWLGMEKVYIMTKTPRQVYFHLQQLDGTWLYLHYSTFSVTNNATFYTLSVSGFVAGDLNQQSFLYNNAKEFYTYDRDNSNTCATRRFGGWWFGNCVYLNINGKYGLYDTESGMIEHYGGYKNLKTTIMKIK